ncbi:hypothetical protein GCM10027346_07010 [Hymenobacter seoulensis]
MRKTTAHNRNGFGLTDYIGLAVMVGVLYLFVSRLIIGSQMSKRLDSERTSIIVGHINNDKEFFGNSPVSWQYYYRYYFKIDGIKYFGDSRDPSKKPGDTLAVRYYIPDPNINEPARK